MAVCLFFLSIPSKSALRGYRTARYVMGAAYLFYAICVCVEYHVIGVAGDSLSRPIIMTIATVQALLFTYTLITLISLNFVTFRRMLFELLPIVVMSIALFSACLFFSEDVALWMFGLFGLFYASLLVRYVFLFRREYHRYELQMDKFFSDDDSRRLLWVKRSFYVALAIGVLALIYALLPVATVAAVFMTIVIVFYTVFGVRFINYALQFQTIEVAITNSSMVTEDEENKVDEGLMQRIDSLMEQDKLFCKSDLSVLDVAERLGERPRTVSAVISAFRQINFKTYINEFRVQEAKRLLDEDRRNVRTIDAIASEAGFANRSTFYRVFKQSQGISPTAYRLKDSQH